jgi:Protein of unknown function (DUF1552)
MIRPLSRRTLLRGAGVSMALPWLEIMMPQKAWAAETPKRFLAFYVPCGIRMNRWTPAQTGSNFTLSPILSPLAASAQKVSLVEDALVLSGLNNNDGGSASGGDHAKGTSSFLTAAKPFQTEGSNIRNATSLDQMMAQAVGAKTSFPSLQWGTQNESWTDLGYSSAYSHVISWSSPTQPLSKEVNPQAAFDRLFMGAQIDQTALDAAKRKKYRLSVLDFVKTQRDNLRSKVGRSDNVKLEQYFTGVRELETRIAATQVPTGPSCSNTVRPAGGNDLRDISTHMLDVIALAFQCDKTRIGSFMLQDSGSYFTFGFLGLGFDHHHGISHHGNDQGRLDAIEKINVWEMEQFAYLARKLKAMPEGAGSVLDNSILYFSSEIEDGASHSHSNLPVLMLGKGGGLLRTGRHERYQNTSIGNLFVSLLQGVGGTTASFGDSTGPLGNLT